MFAAALFYMFINKSTLHAFPQDSRNHISTWRSLVPDHHETNALETDDERQSGAGMENG